MDAALFITCLADQLLPRIGVAATGVLRRLGCRVHFPPDQTCCGRAFHDDGDHAAAADLARRFIGLFEPYEYIVTPGAGCCLMVRRYYGLLLADDPAWAPACQRVAFRTYEFAEFLDSVLRPDFRNLSLPRRRRVAHYSTCHARQLGIDQAGGRILQQIGNAVTVTLDERAPCCGFGGTFSVQFPALSSTLAAESIRALTVGGADTVLVDDPGCALHLASALRHHRSPLQVMHLAELLAEAMDLPTDGL